MLKQVQRRAPEMTRRHPSYEDRPRKLGLCSLEKRSLQGDIIVFFQYLKELIRKMVLNFSAESVAVRQEVIVLNEKRLDFF